eukprot:5262573-Alexandrium_andersonii.AAC.1
MAVPVVQGVMRQLLLAQGFDLPDPPWVTGEAQADIAGEAYKRACEAIDAHSRSISTDVDGGGDVRSS